MITLRELTDKYLDWLKKATEKTRMEQYEREYHETDQQRQWEDEGGRSDYDD